MKVDFVVVLVSEYKRVLPIFSQVKKPWKLPELVEDCRKKGKCHLFYSFLRSYSVHRFVSIPLILLSFFMVFTIFFFKCSDDTEHYILKIRWPGGQYFLSLPTLILIYLYLVFLSLYEPNYSFLAGNVLWQKSFVPLIEAG